MGFNLNVTMHEEDAVVHYSILLKYLYQKILLAFIAKIESIIVIVDSVANRIEAVIVADVQTVAKIDYVCHAFASDALNSLVRETDRKMRGYQLRNFNLAFCLYSCGRLGSRG